MSVCHSYIQISYVFLAYFSFHHQSWCQPEHRRRAKIRRCEKTWLRESPRVRQDWMDNIIIILLSANITFIHVLLPWAFISILRTPLYIIQILGNKLFTVFLYIYESYDCIYMQSFCWSLSEFFKKIFPGIVWCPAVV